MNNNTEAGPSSLPSRSSQRGTTKLSRQDGSGTNGDLDDDGPEYTGAGSSRLSQALSRVRSADAYPPGHIKSDHEPSLPDVARSISRQSAKQQAKSRTRGNSIGVNGSHFREGTGIDEADIEAGNVVRNEDKDEDGEDGDEGDEGDEGEKEEETVPVLLDIEHAPCDDDPRLWSKAKKNVVMSMIILAFFGPLTAASIYNPVIDEVKTDLHGTDTQIGLTLSLFILFQGLFPIVWSTIAEIHGRKYVYAGSFIIYTTANLVASRAMNMPTFVAMRAMSAMGSASVNALGAATLADMFDAHERGQKLGLYYGLPLLAPSLGPLIGGALGHAFGWRAALYFLAVFGGTTVISFFFFPDTWRRERSKVYQSAISHAMKRALHHDAEKEKRRIRKLSKQGFQTNQQTSATPYAQPATPISALPPDSALREGTPRSPSSATVTSSTPTKSARGSPSAAVDRPRLSSERTGAPEVNVDIEKGEVVVQRSRWLRGFGKKKVSTDEEAIKPSFRDLNPLPSIYGVFKMPTNTMIITASGILFGAQYCIPYTASLTLAKAPYSYNALNIGLVILSFGVGSIFGSVLGGRLSDWSLRKLKRTHGGKSIPEFRLKSTFYGMPPLLLSFLAYAWTTGKHVHIAGPIVALFFCGLSIMLVYSSTLAYLVDANPGRSAAAVACNSIMRGIVACVCSQIASPIQNAIGDGGLYSMFTGFLAVTSGCIILIAYKGENWRTGGLWQRKRKATV